MGHFAETMLFGKDVDYCRRATESGKKITYYDLDSLIYRRYARNVANYQSSYGKLALELIIRNRSCYRDK
jgi:GT2 family glycosyltransferase